MSEAFDQLAYAVKARWKNNARHKRGFRLRERPALSPLLHAIEEATEVARADLHNEGKGRIESELGDTITGLLIYAEARGLDIDRVLRGAADKIIHDIVMVHPESQERT